MDNINDMSFDLSILESAHLFNKRKNSGKLKTNKFIDNFS